MQTVGDVLTVFAHCSMLSQSGFATVFVVPEYPEYLLRVQEYTPDVLEEIRFGQRMEEAGLAPLSVSHYFDGCRHAMLTERYQMDLEHWFTVSTREAQERSMWTMRVSRLFRGMARIGLFCIDLKPANIVVNVEQTGTPTLRAMKLIDFGGGLCWDSVQLLGTPVPWRAVYATLLLVFNASLQHSQPLLYASYGLCGPFTEQLQKLLCVPETRSLVVQILGRPLVRRYWSNLFFRVPMEAYIAHFIG
jgi:hypothetical protein